MDMNSTSSLDTLATLGVLDFDADAYVKGTKPKYVGNPQTSNMLPYSKPSNGYSSYGIQSGAYLSGYPAVDAFVSRGEKKAPVQVPWKELMTGGVLSAIAIYCGSKIKKILKSKPDLAKNISTTIDNCKTKAKSIIKGTGEIAESTAKTADKTTKIAKKGIINTVKESFLKAKDIVSKLPKNVKIVGGIGIGLIVLHEIYKATNKNQYYR